MSVSNKNRVKSLEFLASFLDNRFKILGVPVGVDPLLGLVPVIGDLLSLILSAYLVGVAVRFKVPKRQILKMVQNVAIDFVLGLVPLFGDIFDLLFWANQRNLKILKKNIDLDVIDGEIVK